MRRDSHRLPRRRRRKEHRLRAFLRRDLFYWWRYTRWDWRALDRLFVDAFGVAGMHAARAGQPWRAWLYFKISANFQQHS